MNVRECVCVCKRGRRCFTTVKKEQQQEYNRDKNKKKKKKGQQAKLAIPNVQKNMSTSLENQRERDKQRVKSFFCIALRKIGRKAGSCCCRR